MANENKEIRLMMMMVAGWLAGILYPPFNASIGLQQNETKRRDQKQPLARTNKHEQFPEKFLFFD